MTTALAPATTSAPPAVVHGDDAPPRADTLTRRLFTVAELYAMAEAGIFHPEERIELLDGEIIVMPPIGEPHSDGTDRLGSDLTYNLHGRARVRVQGPVQLNDVSLPQPDIAVLRLRDDYHLERATAEDVLLLIEVSDTSLEFDRGEKLARYAAAGIPEVWIANVQARQIEGYSDPVDGAYRSRRVVDAEGSISPLAFPDVELAVGDFLLG